MRMLTPPLRAGATTGLFVAAIVAGSLLGSVAPAEGQQIAAFTDPLILLLVGALFFTVRFEGLSALRRAPRLVLIAIAINFVLIPVIALGLTALIPDDALRLGVLIYCLAPCTDWFLGFTRLAGGDTTIGAALIPLQMVMQLMLYPLWLTLFAREHVGELITTAGPTLLTWFVIPAAAGIGLRLMLNFAPSPALRAGIVGAVDAAIPGIIAALIATIFAGNVGAILSAPGQFGIVLVVVFVFFVVIYTLGEGASRLLRLAHPEHVLLTMTTSARNAPIMLAVTSLALPYEPVVHAAIVLGMLIEFPHLAVVTHLLRRRSIVRPGMRT